MRYALRGETALLRAQWLAARLAVRRGARVVDAGNSFQPYLWARAERRGWGPPLKKILVARAFTPYQTWRLLRQLRGGEEVLLLLAPFAGLEGFSTREQRRLERGLRQEVRRLVALWEGPLVLALPEERAERALPEVSVEEPTHSFLPTRRRLFDGANGFTV